MEPRRSILAFGAAAVCTLALGGEIPVAAGGPTTETYPGTCARDATHTLQTCIDQVDPGSTIVLTAEVIEEYAVIDRSLTIRPTDAGLGARLNAIGIWADGTDPSMEVTIRDVRLIVGMNIVLLEGSGHEVLLDRVTIGKESPNAAGISGSVSVPASLTIQRSDIRLDQEDQRAVVSLDLQSAVGDIDVRLVGNRISATGDTESGAGIRLDMAGDGRIDVLVASNVIWDIASCECGAAAGISVLPEGGVDAHVDVIGNTIVRSASHGIGQRNDLTGDGRLALRVFNNIFSHLDGPAVSLDKGAAGTLSYRAGANDTFQTAGYTLDGQAAGSGNLKLDPRFVDRAAGDLRLKGSSPLIDRGIACPPGGVNNLDAAGKGRLAGAGVDMGAYERGATAPTGVVRSGGTGPDPLVGTAGDDILCGHGGDDTLLGKGGRDHLDGGDGEDRLVGGAGPDRLFGRGGADVLCAQDGTAGNDVADGGPGSDRGRTDAGDVRRSLEAIGGAC